MPRCDECCSIEQAEYLLGRKPANLSLASVNDLLDDKRAIEEGAVLLV